MDTDQFNDVILGREAQKYFQVCPFTRKLSLSAVGLRDNSSGRDISHAFLRIVQASRMDQLF